MPLKKALKKYTLFSSIFIYRMFMKDHKIYHFLTGILRACLKIQFKNWLILILKGFLGIIILTFIPSAIGAKKTSSQEIREALDGNISESSPPPDLADLALSPPPALPLETSIGSVLNDPKTSSNESQEKETEGEVLNELANRIHDIAEYLSSNEPNKTVKSEIVSLRRELKEKILSDNLTKKKVSENTKFASY